jgi:hypothetical protein
VRPLLEAAFEPPPPPLLPARLPSPEEEDAVSVVRPWMPLPRWRRRESAGSRRRTCCSASRAAISREPCRRKAGRGHTADGSGSVRNANQIGAPERRSSSAKPHPHTHG